MAGAGCEAGDFNATVSASLLLGKGVIVAHLHDGPGRWKLRKQEGKGGRKISLDIAGGLGDEATGVGRGGGLPQERGEHRWLFVTRRMKKYWQRSYGAHQTSSSPPLQISCPSLARGRRREGPFLRPLTNFFPFLSFPLL